MLGKSFHTPAQAHNQSGKFGYQGDRSQSYSQLNKTFSAYKSTELGTHSQYHSDAVSKLEDVRRTIDDVVLNLSDKRAMNI